MINKDRLLSEFSSLVSIDAPSFGERMIADQLKDTLIKLGFEVEEDNAGEEYNGNCGNIYGYLEGTLMGDPILFSAHMDTVTPASGKKAVVHQDGKITSQGATVLGADDVSGIVSILEAIRSIKERNLPHRRIEVLFTIAEEVYAKGSLAFDYHKLQAKQGYTLDLTGNIGTVAYKAPSILSFKVEICGKAAHAGFAPEKGIHSIGIAAAAISKITFGRVDEETTVNVGTIEGGEATNIVPARCVVMGEVRSFNHEKAVTYINRIHHIFEEESRKYGADILWEENCNCIAYETSREGVVANRYKKACEQLGIPVQFVETFGGSDQNTYAQKGVEGLVLSTAMNNVHSCEEYTEIEELVKSVQIVETLMLSEV